MFIVFLARYAGKILQFWRSLVEKVRFRSVDFHFCASLVRNARFGRLRFQFLGTSRFLARCARGVSKRSETEIARIYVRSLCRWAVAPTLA